MPNKDIDVVLADIKIDLERLGQEINKLFDNETDNDRRQRGGATIYQKIQDGKEDLTAIVAELEEGSSYRDQVNQLIDQLIEITKDLLVRIFDTTPESIEKGLKKYRGEIAGG